MSQICRYELQTIYEDLHDTVINYLITCLHHERSEAEDLFHEGCIRFWRSYDRTRKPLNLMVQIVKNLSYDIRKRPPLPDDYSPNTTEEDPLPDVDVPALLQHYHGREYTVLKLISEGHSYADICVQLGIKRQKLYHILRLIRKNRIVSRQIPTNRRHI